MSRFYAVELKTIAVIQVDDEQDATDAEFRADELQVDILNDARHMTIDCDCIGEVKTAADLNQHGWDAKCLPYGGDGNTMLQDLLPPSTAGVTAPDGQTFLPSDVTELPRGELTEEQWKREEIAAKVCLEVAELPDRTSPEDWPDAMLVTHDELRAIVLAALDGDGVGDKHGD